MLRSRSSGENGLMRMPMKGGSGGETGYSAADHQDRSDLCHIASDRGD